jgi:acyl dehydratase
MPIDKKYIGKVYGPTRYVIGAEKLREFAYAISGGIPSMGFTGTGAPEGLNPLLHDDAAATAGPYGGLIGLPNFAVVFAIAPFGQAVTDPALGINLLMLVHGEQEFEFFDVLRPGDVMTSTGVITNLYDKAGKDFLVLTTESKNQHGKLVVRGTWLAVIRHG